MSEVKPREFWVRSERLIWQCYDAELSGAIRVIEHSAYLAEKERADRLFNAFKEEISNKDAVRLWNENEKLKAENARFKEALNRIVGMVEVWTDEHGQRKTEEIYASRIAREALKGCEK